MNELQGTFKNFVANSGAVIPVGAFLVNMFIAVVLSWVLGLVYVRYGSSLSNRGGFSRNFVLIAMTTLLVITIVKSSLALSLGLVGALSIVRFRTAIKEPEELAYMFMSIALGLGLGADQRTITVIAFVVIAGVIVLRSRGAADGGERNLFLTVHSSGDGRVGLERVVETLRSRCSAVVMKRFDENEGELEALFVVGVRDFAQLDSAREALRGLGGDMKITLLDNSGVV